MDINVKRGDIYYADLSPVVGSEQGGVRPVLIVQNDTGNRYSPTVIAAAITSQTNKAKLPTHIALSAPDYGLPRDSVVLLEQIRTLDKRRLRERMGRVDGELMERKTHSWSNPSGAYGKSARRGENEEYSMKKRNNAFARLVGLLLVSATVLTLTVAATGGAGTSSDPLVTLSYLNEKFLPQILSEVDKKTASREQTLSSKLTEQVKSETQAFEQKYGASSGNASGGTAASFTVVTLNQGQILYMGVGCEAMLRTGSGVCVAASTPGLIDETSGAALAGGLGLQKNHLYMATVDSRGVQASANSTKLLVRGNYSVQ